MTIKYQHTMELLPQIKEMLNSGMTQKEVKNALGLTEVRPIHYLLTRERRKQVQGVAKPRGRKPAKTLQEYRYENKRLRMEIELLRDFVIQMQHLLKQGGAKSFRGCILGSGGKEFRIYKAIQAN